MQPRSKEIQQPDHAVSQGRITKEADHKRSGKKKAQIAKQENPRELTEEEKQQLLERKLADIEDFKGGIKWSLTYYDDVYQYRHYILPLEIAQHLPRNKLLSRKELLEYGLSLSDFWEHYMIHRPEPHIILLRRTKKQAEESYAANSEKRRLLEEEKKKKRQKKREQAAKKAA
ncbi:CKS-domain-containing protein [Hesseltinella vesiculosa]|uniref:Cyclin-dependent kinases regulatory subunit n=1 Tax=Hesseltinella vesiculosa TaxID=101127 RepID=A0A1X2GP66_9FUNG|nr:CKS-domain-containing protein [Hesseltinella vesiculosa]